MTPRLLPQALCIDGAELAYVAQRATGSGPPPEVSAGGRWGVPALRVSPEVAGRQNLVIGSWQMPTVMTVLEARVLREQWGAWAQTYRERLGRAVPSQMVRSVLVQSASDPEVWQGISF